MARSEPTLKTCPQGHPKTRANTYENPVTHHLQCKACKNSHRPPQPSRARAPKAPINPTVIAQLRAAAGIQIREDAR
jgi:hypothetical protein